MQNSAALARYRRCLPALEKIKISVERFIFAHPQGSFSLCLPVVLFVIGIAICLVTGRSVTQAMEEFSYSTLALIIAMKIFTDLIAQTGFMEWIAVRLAIASGGHRKILLAALAGFMFLISSTMNNITAVLCILPCIFVLLKAIAPDKDYLCTFFAVLLALSNLGGAASAVGDLPAILIMNTGAVSFLDYTMRAFPFFGASAGILVAFWLAVLSFRKRRKDAQDTGMAEFAIGVLGAQYRYVTIDRQTFVPLMAILLCMLVCWMAVPQSVMGPEVIAIVGCLAAAASVHFRKGKADQIINMESVLKISAFLFVAAAVSSSGILTTIASTLQAAMPDQKSYLLVVLLLTSLISGLIGAGPAAAVCLPVITGLATTTYAASCPIVMVAYAAAICAGSSLFMWSATAGFILSGKIFEAGLNDSNGNNFLWGIKDYLPFGLANYAIQMSIALIATTMII